MTHPFGISDEEHQHRMEAAKRRAGWELGSRSWADVILDAYLYPEENMRALHAEQEKPSDSDAG